MNLRHIIFMVQEKTLARYNLMTILR